jgi:hypothetical protein
MDYSIIIPYRGRHQHLIRLLPALHEQFQNKNYEIIVVEQTDTEKFKKAMINNIGAKKANGKFFIFHDVDHLPDEKNVDYFRLEKDTIDVWYPVYNVVYVQEENDKLKLRSENDIPSGYRSHHIKVHSDHFGGVFCCTQRSFEIINGFNPLFKGWGFEDSDIRNRFEKSFDIKRANKPGTFFAMDHSDSHPAMDDPDFIRNTQFAFYGQVTYKNLDEVMNLIGEQSLYIDDRAIHEIPKYGVRWICVNTNYVSIDGDDPGVKRFTTYLDMKLPEQIEK